MVQYHFTLRLINGRFKLLDGLPADHGLEPTMAHTFTEGDEMTIWWLVDCELDEQQVRAIARDVLARWDD